MQSMTTERAGGRRAVPTTVVPDQCRATIEIRERYEKKQKTCGITAGLNRFEAVAAAAEEDGVFAFSGVVR